MGKINKYTLLIAGIIALAAWLRLYRISDYMTFLGDEGRDVLVVYNILHGQLTLLGPTMSVGGFFLGPIYYYLMTPFLWLFNYDPVGPAVMVALFGILTVGLLYKFASEFFDRKTAITAALLYAISPVVIAYSRSSWNPNVTPFFTLLLLYVLYKALVKNSKWLLFATGVIFGICMQLHYVETFVIPTIVFFVLFFRFYIKQLKSKAQNALQVIKDGVFLFIGYLIGWSPFLAFELRHDFANFRSITNFIFNSGETGGGEQVTNQIWQVLFMLFSRLLTGFPPFEQYPNFDKNLLSLWSTGSWILIFLSIAFFIYKLIQAFKKNDQLKKAQFVLVLLWFVFGVSMFGFYKKPIYIYYFEFMFPIPFLLVGNFLSTAFSEKGAFTKNKLFDYGRKTLAALILLALVWVNLQGIPFRFSANRQKDQVKLISDFVLSKTDGKPFNFALITGGNSDHGYRYFFKLEGKDPIVIENEQVDPKRTTVTDQLLVVCEDTGCGPLGHSLWEVAGFGRAEIAGQWDVSVVKVYKLVPYKGPM